MVGRPGKGQNKEIQENCCCLISIETITKRYQDQVFPNETWRILNERMMPDATAMAPELEIGKHVRKFNVSRNEFRGTPTITCSL
jgi:hypothetical protein